MSRIYFKTAFLFVVWCSSLSWGQTLLHYWNFNNNASVAAITTPTATIIPGAGITASLTGISAIDFAGGTGQNFNVLNLNAQNSDASGTHLRFNDPIGSALIFALPTTGYENAIVKFATRRSSSGAGTQVWSYSIDGINYTFFANVTPNNGDPALATLDFSSINGTDNNPNFKLKVEFQLAPGGNVGNNRFDNFTVHGTTFTGSVDTTAPIAAFLPSNGTINVASNTHPTISFNENVRLLNDNAITNTNVDALVELRLNNAAGALVPFDATFASNTIVITPASPLSNNQQYYVALLPNTIEDESNNAITSIQSASFSTVNPSVSSIDLSTYVRVGRYDLPEPTRTAHPVNSLLAQEVSAVTYNWDTNTLFVVGDGSTSIVQITKQGQLINSMTLAQGSSPQGTEFYDTEGLTYIGNGQFVMSEERDRQVVLFTYVPDTTLTRSNTQTVKLGTFVSNTGTEGLSYDPLTNGYIVLKEIDPMGIFQTNIDFNAGTATNGSATTENSVNLFNPALLGVTDVADVFALSNLPVAVGQPLANNLLVLSQESAKVVNIDRNGNIASTLTIVSDPGNPLNVASQQHEGLTMDSDGILYVVSENGGGDIDHPQLWVYAPSTTPNQAPTAVALTNTVTSVLENTSTATPIKVADIVVTDDGFGTNDLTLSGVDAASFQITGSSLYIKAGVDLDFEVKTSYAVTINVDDSTVGSTPDASVSFVVSVTDVVVETPPAQSVIISEVAAWGSGNSPVGADWFEVTNNGSTALDITGWKVDDNSNSFAAAIALTGVTSIAPGESVIFMESTAANPATTIIPAFKTLWFGANPPTSLQIGTYQGSGIGLSTSGDALNLYNAAGVLQTNVIFGTSPTTVYRTFNNAIGLNNATISTLSQVGVNDAFAAVNDAAEIGSPGSIGRLFISEVAPWSSGNSPVGADWFEVTNTKAVAVDITGWKVDDNSQSPVAAVALNGITSINPGESVIFIETNNLATATTAFLNNWFGTNPSGSLRIGNYTGGGIGLGTGGDQVNLYNNSGVLQTSVLFGTSPTTTFTTFDNAIGRNSLVTPITQLSAVGINGAFIAANSTSEIGSPGTITTAPCPTITVTALPASSIVCVGTTTTVAISATGGTLPYTVTGSPLTVGGGTYTYTVTDAKGCTGTTSITIIEQPFSDNTTTATACNSYTWAANGQTYTASGTYTGATVGCVTDKLVLTINNSTTNGSTSITAAGSYTWPLPLGTGLTYSTSGTYTSTTTNAAGCPNTATLNLTISVNTFNLGTSCGATVSNLAVTVVAAPVAGTATYTFRLRNMVTNAVQIITRPVNSFALSNYPGITLGTLYQIEVSTNNGVNYGPACMVNTPSPTSTIGAQCGTTLSSMTEWVYATYYSSITGYRFRITNTSNNTVQVVDSALNRFNFNQLSNKAFGTTYFVEVALKNTDGTYLPYSAGCNITTPAFPTTAIVASQCESTATSLTQNIAAVVVTVATEYRFQLSRTDAPTYSATKDRVGVNTFNLSMFTGLSAGTVYTVQVAVKIDGVWGPYGAVCHITTPGGVPTKMDVNSSLDRFEVTSSPNPFSENFTIAVATAVESAIQIKVYDMTGRQLESKTVEPSDATGLAIGESYPSGVYNVVVTQGEHTKTFRVIKR